MGTDVSALEFNFDSPTDVDGGEEFEVRLDVGVSEDYDVKIFVYDGEYSDIVSEIYFDEKWNNPYYYLKNALPDEDSYRVRVVNFEGETEICARLRKSGGTTYNQVCNGIDVSSGGNEKDEEELSQKSRPVGGVGDYDDGDEGASENGGEIGLGGENGGEEKSDFVPLSKIGGGGKIVLGGNLEKSGGGGIEGVGGENVFVSKQERLRFWVVVAFLVFALAVIVFLVLRKF